MKSRILLRIWTLADARFVMEVRNSPELQKWFKQDSDLTLREQIEFMMSKAPEQLYYGFIIELEGLPIGICSLKLTQNKTEAEFGIAILPHYQGHGYAIEAMRQLVSIGFNEFALRRIYSDVFVSNPALPFYIWKCGFTSYGVRERAYFKKDWGFVDTVLIEVLK